MTRAEVAGWLSGLGWVLLCAWMFNAIALVSPVIAFMWVLVCAPAAPSVALMVYDTLDPENK